MKGTTKTARSGVFSVRSARAADTDVVSRRHGELRRFAMEPGPEIDRVEFSPWFGWLFRAQVRALTVHEHGLVMVRGTGTEFVPWSDVGQVMAGERGLRSRSTGEASDVFHYFILVVRGEVIEMPSQIARQAGQRIAMHIAERAQLQWMDLPNGMRSARRLK